MTGARYLLSFSVYCIDLLVACNGYASFIT